MLSISDAEFEDIKRIMFDLTGVRLKETKKPLVISRLRRRLEELGDASFSTYIKRLSAAHPDEMEYLVNALTTNETFFFRHTKQFNFLYEKILPAFVEQGKKKIEVWSGASSTGEEPYSLSIALTEFAKKYPLDFKIYASDINTEVIAQAQEAVYDERSLKEVSQSLRERYFKPVVKSRMSTQYMVTDQIKSKVEFFEHNLQQASTLRGMDIIFLRNVLIYFERDIKEKVINLLEPSLRSGGYFVISLSENLSDIQTQLRLIESGVFIKP